MPSQGEIEYEMKKLAETAETSYKNAPKTIKEGAEAFCRNMFRQTEKYSLTKRGFLEVMHNMGHSRYADEDLFKMLTAGRNHLAMSEARTLYYIISTRRPFCRICDNFIPDVYFYCSKCPDGRYTICLHCYGKKAHVHHKHYDPNELVFLDSNVPVVKRSRPTTAMPKLQISHHQIHEVEGERKQDLQIVPIQSYTRPPAQTQTLDKGKGKQDLQIVERPPANPKMSKREIMDKESMKKLANIANLHYNAAPPRIKNSVDDFFKSMVKQKGNSSVTLNDFLESMNEQKHSKYANKELFQMLVKDRKKGMSMSECRNLYYILMSGRPFCSNCRHFILDIYICCNKCSASSYTLCLHCYSDKEVYTKHKHYGKDDAYFYDCTVLTSPAAPNQESGSSNALVKWNQDKRKIPWDEIHKTVNIVLKVSLIFAAISSACTIM